MFAMNTQPRSGIDGTSCICSCMQMANSGSQDAVRRSAEGLLLGAADPAAEQFDYPVAFDVRELVTLDDVMDEMDLGPNGCAAARVRSRPCYAVSVLAMSVPAELHTAAATIAVSSKPLSRCRYSSLMTVMQTSLREPS